jgi:activating signal cointegrator 1
VTINVISLWQPWAWAIEKRVKLYETRSETFVRNTGIKKRLGPIAIHAAKKKFNPWDYDNDFAKRLSTDGLRTIDSLVYGAVLCIVDLVDVIPAVRIRGRLDSEELMYGNYEEGRYALKLDNIRPLPVPYPLRGHQGIFKWDVPAEFEHLLRNKPKEAQ